MAPHATTAQLVMTATTTSDGLIPSASRVTLAQHKDVPAEKAPRDG
jgi:hypothetical protein